MLYSDDEEHSPSEFYYLGEAYDILAAKVFSGLFYKVNTKITIQQSHIINPLLTSFARSVKERSAFGFYGIELAALLLGLYVKPQAIFSRTDLALDLANRIRK